MSNCFLNIYVYNYRLVLLSALVMEASVYTGKRLTQRHNKLSRSNCCVFSPKPAPRFREHFGRVRGWGGLL